MSASSHLRCRLPEPVVRTKCKGSFALKIEVQDDSAMVLVRIRSRTLLPFALCLLTFAFPSNPLEIRAGCYFAQEPKPYAAIDHDAVNYNGPGRDAAHDISDKDIGIGLLLPLSGPRQAEGETLRRAAQMAIDEENDLTPHGRQRLLLVVRDETGPWGQASAQIVNMVFDDHAVALITSTEGASAHLAEQVGNKIGVPVLTLGSDSTTTEINLPWIFRVGPTDTAQAQAFARDIYRNRKLERVNLVTQDDRDSRLGGQEFVKAARGLSPVAPTRIVLGGEKLSDAAVLKELESAQAVVVWGDALTGTLIAERLRQLRLSVPLYICRKAADSASTEAERTPVSGASQPVANRWIAAPLPNREAWDGFDQRYHQRFGIKPGSSAAEAYDAVRLLAASLRKSGPNRARLRDVLAQVSDFPGAAGTISFDHAGNDTSQIRLLEYK